MTCHRISALAECAMWCMQLHMRWLCVVCDTCSFTCWRLSLWLCSTRDTYLLPASQYFVYANWSKLLLYTPWIIKNKMPNSFPYLRQILMDFQSSLTATLSRKFLIKRSLQIPPHLTDVATLRCEMLVFKNCIDRKHSNGRVSAHAVKKMSENATSVCTLSFVHVMCVGCDLGD